MKPEVGMFYRYKGQIGKYKKITELDRYPSFTNNYLRKNEVILLNNAKFSYNIIDLIEVGDFVNGSPICLFKTDEKDRIWIYTDSNYKYGYLENEIKSIVTKEQFEQMAYKVEE